MIHHNSRMAEWADATAIATFFVVFATLLVICRLAFKCPFDSIVKIQLLIHRSK